MSMPPSSSGVLLLLDVYLKSNQLLCQTDANFLLMTVGITSGYHMTGYHIQRQSSDNETTAFRERVCSVCHGLKVSHRVSLCVCVCVYVFMKSCRGIQKALNEHGRHIKSDKDYDFYERTATSEVNISFCFLFKH